MDDESQDYEKENVRIIRMSKNDAERVAGIVRGHASRAARTAARHLLETSASREDVARTMELLHDAHWLHGTANSIFEQGGREEWKHSCDKPGCRYYPGSSKENFRCEACVTQDEK